MLVRVGFNTGYELPGSLCQFSLPAEPVRVILRLSAESLAEHSREISSHIFSENNEKKNYCSYALFDRMQ